MDGAVLASIAKEATAVLAVVVTARTLLKDDGRQTLIADLKVMKELEELKEPQLQALARKHVDHRVRYLYGGEPAAFGPVSVLRSPITWAFAVMGLSAWQAYAVFFAGESGSWRVLVACGGWWVSLVIMKWAK